MSVPELQTSTTSAGSLQSFPACTVDEKFAAVLVHSHSESPHGG